LSLVVLAPAYSPFPTIAFSFITSTCVFELFQDPEAMVIDHINYASTSVEGDHTLIAGDDLIQSDVIFGSKKIEVITHPESLPDPFEHSVPCRVLHVRSNYP
jgi:hypothetical protein